MLPYPDWLNPGDNAWQLVAATLVGLMSLPGIAVLYGGIVQRKWAVNTIWMAFTGFSLVLVVWVLWGFKMGFGQPLKLGSLDFCDARAQAAEVNAAYPDASAIAFSQGKTRVVFAFRQRLREDAAVVISGLKQAGYRIAMLSGDRREPVADIAAALELTPQAVKSLLSRARINLREILQPYFDAGEIPNQTTVAEDDKEEETG